MPQAALAPSPRLAVVTFDGSLLGAAPASRAIGGRPGGMLQPNPQSSPERIRSAPGNGSGSRRERPRGQAGTVLLDKGECEHRCR